MQIMLFVNRLFDSDLLALSLSHFQRNYRNYIASTIEFRMHFLSLKKIWFAEGNGIEFDYFNSVYCCYFDFFSPICLRRAQLSPLHSANIDVFDIVFLNWKPNHRNEKSGSNWQFFTPKFLILFFIEKNPFEKRKSNSKRWKDKSHIHSHRKHSSK